jgi:branched-chain amino acid transport system substrate-binding protein
VGGDRRVRERRGGQHRTARRIGLIAAGGAPRDVVAGRDAVWTIDERGGRLVGISLDYRRVVHRFALPRPAVPPQLRPVRSFDAWALGAGAVWVTDGSSRITGVDPRAGHLTRIETRQPLNDVTVAGGRLWAISGPRATVVGIDPRRHRVTDRIPIASRPGARSPYPIAVEAGLGSLWVLNANTATVTRIDPVERVVVGTTAIGIQHSPARMAVGAPLRATAVAHGGSTVTPLPASSCSPLDYRPGGRPRLLVASDFPLQAPNPEQGLQITDAIRFVLARHGFRAGRFSIAFQACDNSTPTPDVDFLAKCAPNARAYARDASLVAVIGSFFSDCTRLEVPILNGAAGGAIAEISPSSTYVGLTRAGPGATRGEPRRYAPSGRRSFLRLIPADDVQAAADAQLAHRLGVRRVYVLQEEDSGYGRGVAAAFRHAAARLDVRVAGTAPFSGRPRFARRVRASGADGVFLAGNTLPFGPSMIAAPRRALPAARLLAPDGFAASDPVHDLGPSAEGLTVSVPGLPVERLHGSGARFVAQFGAAIGQRPDPYAVYAAQATEVLLAAIERSDGTRASILRELFATRERHGMLGTFVITPEGDMTAGAVGIYRVVHGALRLTRVITPPMSLVRR